MNVRIVGFRRLRRIGPVARKSFRRVSVTWSRRADTCRGTGKLIINRVWPSCFLNKPFHVSHIRDIPDAAWEYVVNGNPALAWVRQRQGVRTDKASDIVSDANRYVIATVGYPRCPLDLFLRVITVSLETMRIVRSLPDLAIDSS
ncbi:MAG: hypothetical protein OXD42_03155 [Rhodospirillaceae bacterium]|nr:hypothetical protein [Rhodospirillaceae bacterium]